MPTLNETQLKTFLSENLRPETFNVFAAISVLKNPDNIKNILELLESRVINLNAIANLPVIDDREVANLIDQYYRLALPNITSSGTSSNQVYTWLTTDTLLGDLLQEYNQYTNENFGSTYTSTRFSALRTSFTNGVYANGNDLELDFQQKVVQPLLEEFSVSDVADLLPIFPDSKEQLTSDFRLFVTRLKEFLTKELTDHFTNEKLSELFIWTEERTSVVVENLPLINEVFNLVEFSSIIDIHLSNTIFELSARPDLVFSRSTIDAMWSELFLMDFSSQNISNLITYLRYRIALINTIEQKNNGTPQTLLASELDNILNYVQAYKELHIMVETRILTTMHVQTF